MQAPAFDPVCPDGRGGSCNARVILPFDPEGGLPVIRNAGYESCVRCR